MTETCGGNSAYPVVGGVCVLSYQTDFVVIVGFAACSLVDSGMHQVGLGHFCDFCLRLWEVVTAAVRRT